MFVLFWVVLLPLIAAFALPFINSKRKVLNLIVSLLPFSLFLALCTMVDQVRISPLLEPHAWNQMLGISMNFYIDGLSIYFGLLISGMGVLVNLFSIFYLSPTCNLGRFYSYMMLFMGSMLGIVFASNLLCLFVFWELTSISSYFLIGFWHDRKEAREAALKSILITGLGGLFLLAGFVLLYNVTGTLEIPELLELGDEVKSSPYYLPILLLILIGAFTKSAQFPFHIWLPDAMVAPTPVSCYLHSATMVKAGIFLIARLSPIFSGTQVWFFSLSSIGLMTMIIGAYLAIKQTDLKALLAYSTISQLGIMVTMFGFDTSVGKEAAILYVLNHALFKGSLFLLVGAIEHETGTKDLRKLGGLIKNMPYTGILVAFSAISMAGLPPLMGFWAKELFFESTLHIPWHGSPLNFLRIVIPLVAVVGSIFTVTYSIMVFHRVFLERREDGPLQAHEAPVGMLISPGILISLSLFLGLFPNILKDSLFQPAILSILQYNTNLAISLWHGLSTPLFMSLVAVLMGTITYANRASFQKVQDFILPNFSLNHTYEGAINLLNQTAELITGIIQNGYLKFYIMTISGFLIVMGGYTFISKVHLQWENLQLSPITPFDLLITCLIIISTLGVVLAQNRIRAILFLGIVGYLVVLLYVVFRAPDLALTQVLIETLSIILFLLTFYHLPKFFEEKTPSSIHLRDLAISGALGALVTSLVVVAIATPLFPSVSQYFVENSYLLAGGKNIVNIILVDFRGYDTMGEITVLAIAGMGVYALARLRERGKPSPSRRGGLAVSSLAPGLAATPILRVVTRITLQIMLLFSFYLLFKGHTSPGGGFIAGLVASICIALQSLTFGLRHMGDIFPFDQHKVLTLGLFIAAATGFTAMVFGYPFLTSTHGFFHFPLFGEIEILTSFFFDLGIFLVVIGVTLRIITTIARN